MVSKIIRSPLIKGEKAKADYCGVCGIKPKGRKGYRIEFRFPVGMIFFLFFACESCMETMLRDLNDIEGGKRRS